MCGGGGVRQHEEGRSQWEGILCLESLGHTVHSTEKEQEHRGRAEISRLPDFVHKSLTEQLCRKLLLTKLQKKQGHIPAGKSSKETHPSSSAPRASKSNLCLFRVCSYPVKDTGFKHIGKVSHPPLPIGLFPWSSYNLKDEPIQTPVRFIFLK